MPNETVNYRLLDSLIEDVVKRNGYSETLRTALYVVSAITRDGHMAQPAHPHPAMSLTDDVTEETIQQILDMFIKTDD